MEPPSVATPQARYLDPGRAAVVLAWLLAIVYSLAPFDFTLDRTTVLDRDASRESTRSLALVLHLMTFATVGAADRQRAGIGQPRRLIVPSVLATGLLVCWGIEACQALTASRHPRGVDVVVNSLGFLLGHAGVATLHRFEVARLVRLKDRALALSVNTPRGLLLVWCALWCSLILLPVRYTSLREWDASYRLHIGNERSLDRPWAGELRFVALYDRALEPSEVKRCLGLQPGHGEGDGVRRDMGLLAGYDFTQSGQQTIRPQGRSNSPDLRIDLTKRVRRTTANPAALILDGELLSTAAPAAQLSAAIAATNTFSIEVWFKPSNLVQDGPARIAGISNSVWRRNFTLGQDGDALSFRVRNGFNGPNGMKFELIAPKALSGDPVQVVAVYADGRSAIYRNGEPLFPAVDLREPAVLLRLGHSGLASGPVAALLCAVSLVFASSLAEKRAAARTRFFRLLLFGFGVLLTPLVLGLAFSTRLPVSLHLWFAPAFGLAWVLATITKPGD